MKIHLDANKEAQILLEEDESIKAYFDRVSQMFEKLNSGELRKSNRSSDKIRLLIKDSLGDWTSSNLVDHTFPSANVSLKDAHLRVAARIELSGGLGLPTRQISLDLALNNRESMANHLLKLEIANRQMIEPLKSLGILVVGSEPVIEAGWDNAVGTDIEYRFALHNTYKPFLTTPIVVASMVL